ncbi:MAG: hypothetical protein EP317_04905 [Bacillota bacterium]|nr:MAG: hypothetical protein EP317_04905 [Bacillota bacterium]
MKTLHKIILITLSVGILFIVISIIGGLNIPIIGGFFNEDEAYGEELGYESSTEIDTIDFEFDDRHVNVTYIESGQISFSYYEHEDDTWTFSEENGVLSVIQTRKFSFFAGFNFKFSSREVRTVDLFIPLDMIDNLSINTHVGDIDLDLGGMVLVDVKLSSDTGDVEATMFESETLELSTDTGNIELSDADISTTIDVSNDTGDIRLENVSAVQIDCSTSTGNIYLDEVSAEALELRNSTGNINIQDSEILTSIKATTSTDNISVENTNALSYDLRTSTGNVIFNHDDLSGVTIKYDLIVSVGNITIDGQSQGTRHSTATGDISIKASSSTGNIRIRTQQP